MLLEVAFCCLCLFAGTWAANDTSSTQFSLEDYSIDAVVAFGANRMRSFWEPYLRYWPYNSSKNRLLLITEKDNWNLNTTTAFRKCLERSSYTPEFVSLHYSAADKPYWFRQNAWKFFLDTHSDADIFAVIDDDSCLLDSVRHTDLLTSSASAGGQQLPPRLIVHGLETPPNTVVPNGHKTFTQFVPKAMGMAFKAHFMTDFPISFWREMLPDFRAWAVSHTLNETLHPSIDAQHDQLARALESMSRQGGLSEFNLIFHFAYFDEKWHDRYDWRLAPSRLSVGLSTHEHATGCPPTWTNDDRVMKMESTSGNGASLLPSEYLFYPYNLILGHSQRHAGSFRSVNWKRFLVEPMIKNRKSAKATYDKSLETQCYEGQSTAACWANMTRTREAVRKPPTVHSTLPLVAEQWKTCFEHMPSDGKV
jgi:hypothetical protein